eukprot:Amastigsp_a4574_54.p2 type:complete len:180 gc:universal Amastigsp_a4574_54:493-1032(+)
MAALGCHCSLGVHLGHLCLVPRAQRTAARLSAQYLPGCQRRHLVLLVVSHDDAREGPRVVSGADVLCGVDLGLCLYHRRVHGAADCHDRLQAVRRHRGHVPRSAGARSRRCHRLVCRALCSRATPVVDDLCVRALLAGRRGGSGTHNGRNRRRCVGARVAEAQRRATGELSSSGQPVVD